MMPETMGAVWVGAAALCAPVALFQILHPVVESEKQLAPTHSCSPYSR